MNDPSKTNAPEKPEETNEELTPSDQEQISGGAFDAYLNFNSATPPPGGSHGSPKP